jgi:hypothetical protein
VFFVRGDERYSGHDVDGLADCLFDSGVFQVIGSAATIGREFSFVITKRPLATSSVRVARRAWTPARQFL